jgi:hypothetical protein
MITEDRWGERGFLEILIFSITCLLICEQGRPLPDEYKSDCWNDVDETEFACQVVQSLKYHMYRENIF